MIISDNNPTNSNSGGGAGAGAGTGAGAGGSTNASSGLWKGPTPANLERCVRFERSLILLEAYLVYDIWLSVEQVCVVSTYVITFYVVCCMLSGSETCRSSVKSKSSLCVPFSLALFCSLLKASIQIFSFFLNINISIFCRCSSSSDNSPSTGRLMKCLFDASAASSIASLTW
jgi:hypothetical protein